MTRSTTVVLPAPEGAETTNSCPRLALFDILHLLPHLLELRLDADDRLGDAEAVGLGADRVDLAVHLLEEEVQFPAARLGSVRKRRPLLHVSAEPDDLFADVRARGEAHD